MSSKDEIKAQARAQRAAEKLQAAIQNGLSLDKSNITAEPVFKDLVEGSKPRYGTMMVDWWVYLEEYPNSDPRKMEDMKHFSEFVGRFTKPRLEAYPTVKSIRRKVLSSSEKILIGPCTPEEP